MLLCSAPVAKSVIADYLAPSKPKHKKRVKKEVCAPTLVKWFMVQGV